MLYYNDAYHLMLNGNDAGSDYEIKINASNTEVWQAASPFTAGTEDAALADKIMDLDQFSGVLAGDESITITGLMHDGTAVNHSLSVNENTTLNQLIEEINDAFGGTATATLVNGQIRLTDNTNGASQMALSLAYNPGSGATTLIGPGDQPGHAGRERRRPVWPALPAAISPRRSPPRIPAFKVDGYPLGADEWITRSSNTINDVITG